MNELSITNFYIIFHDGSNVKVSQEEYERILNTIDNHDFFKIKDNLYKSNSISKVLSEMDYREQYPQEEHSRVFVNSEEKKYEKFDWTKEKRKSALGQMIKGLKKYITEAEMPTSSAEFLLKRMELKLNNTI